MPDQKSLGETKSNSQYISTYPKGGYRLRKAEGIFRRSRRKLRRFAFRRLDGQTTETKNS